MTDYVRQAHAQLRYSQYTLLHLRLVPLKKLANEFSLIWHLAFLSRGSEPMNILRTSLAKKRYGGGLTTTKMVESVDFFDWSFSKASLSGA